MGGMLGAVQTKVSVGAPGDRLEREADQAATRVVSGQEVARISRLAASGLSLPARRQVPEEEELATGSAQVEDNEIQAASPEGRSEEEEPVQMARARRQAPGEKLDEEKAGGLAQPQGRPGGGGCRRSGARTSETMLSLAHRRQAVDRTACG